MRLRRYVVRLSLLAVVATLTACGSAPTTQAPASSTPTPSLRPSRNAGATIPSGTTPTEGSTGRTPSTPPLPTAKPTATSTIGTGRPGDSHGAPVTPVVSNGPRNRPQVAITFDADLTAAMRRRLLTGRVRSYYNAALVAELRQLQVPTTMFLTGMWMDQYPGITRQLAADPLFELGTHTYDHRGFTRHCYTLGAVPPAEMLDDVRRAVRILDRLDPHATRWFRFPGGCLDGLALHETAPAGGTAVQFDVAGGDGFTHDPAPIVRRVLQDTQNGSIIVLHMHGGDTAPVTAQALPAIVAGLRARGYHLVTITQLLA